MAVESTTRAAASRSNFYFSFFFLPSAQRDAIERVYRFCRTVDDAADEDLPLEEKKTRIEGWRRELGLCYGGRPSHPVAASLLEPIRSFGLSREYFEGLIDAVESDLTVTRYETFEALSRYGYGVAGCVGLLCLQIFGVPVGIYRDYAVSLGMAFQLTNILRDLASDGRRGRIYLPLEDLRKFGYSEAELLSGTYNEAFFRVMDFEYQQARSLFDRTRGQVRPDDRGRLLAAEIMSAIYASLLERIRMSRFRVFDRKITVPSHRKLLIAVGCRLRAGIPGMAAGR